MDCDCSRIGARIDGVYSGFVVWASGNFSAIAVNCSVTIFQQLLGSRPEDFHYFLELINFGTLLALLIYYRKRIVKIIGDVFVRKNYRLFVNVIITCIPAGLAGLLLSDFIEGNGFFSSLYTIAIAMGVVGLLMIFSDFLPKKSELRDENSLTPGRALLIGLAQVFALIPGVSRSGSTILAGRAVGLNAKSAADYSFLVSIPLMLAVCGKTLLSSSTRAYLVSNAGMLVVANLVAFASGLAAIYFVMKYLKKSESLKAFGFYRVIVALVVLIAMLIQ